MTAADFARITLLRKELANQPGPEHCWYLLKELQLIFEKLGQQCAARADAEYLAHRKQMAGVA